MQDNRSYKLYANEEMKKLTVTQCRYFIYQQKTKDRSKTLVSDIKYEKMVDVQS
jgi:hypothetical protein